MTIRAQVIGDDDVRRFLEARARIFTVAVRDGIEAGAIFLSRKVKDSKLSGQVLKNRTGRLRRSINYRLEGGLAEPEAVVGTNVEYGRVHEFGLTVDQAVRAHIREVKSAWGRAIEPREVNVRAHTRRVSFPERSFLRSALRDNRVAIEQKVMKALKEATRAAVS